MGGSGSGGGGFEGGGTAFPGASPPFTAAPRTAGACVSFCGLQRHAGLAVTRGVRYILAGFVRVHDGGATRRAATELFP